jgi:steroid delta-isomerase-like uncharacterized protein
MQHSVQDLTRTIHAHFSENALEKVLPYLHDQVTVNAYAFGMTLHGKEGFMGFMQSFKQAFPDVTITHRNMIAEGGKVAVEFTGEGTHTGPLNTPGGAIPPSGKKVVFQVCEVLEWENGKLKSLSNYQDSTALMKQIGAI